MFHRMIRITCGSDKGGILLVRVASVAEVAARLLLLVGSAPGCGLACFPLGGCWRLLDHAGETAWLCDCRRWPLALTSVPVGLRFRRVRALVLALRVEGGLPPRRCACTVSCAPVCASELAVAAAASIGGGL